MLSFDLAFREHETSYATIFKIFSLKPTKKNEVAVCVNPCCVRVVVQFQESGVTGTGF